jgi:8-oxo-dGTP diphosphatase
VSGRLRQAARALVLDPDDRVLLVRFDFSGVEVWATPGGGVKPHETHHQALLRELDEELGLTDVVIGPYVWNRTFLGRMLTDRYDGQQDHIYLVRTEAFSPQPSMTWDELNAEHLMELRWWSLAEIEAATAAGRRFGPLALADELRSLLYGDGLTGDLPIELGF